MKKSFKIIALVLLSFGFVYYLSKNKIIDINLLKNALEQHKLLLLTIALLQVMNYVGIGFRYKSILKILGLEKKTRHAVSATLVSNALGQWLPGSVAFVEILRVGFSLKVNQGNQLTPHEKFSFAMASLFDRIIGLFMTLLLGSVITFYFVISAPDKHASSYFILLCVFIINLSLCLMIMALPLIAGSKSMQHILAQGERFFLRVLSGSKPRKIVMGLFHKLNDLIKIFSENGKNYKLFLVPMSISLFSVFCFTLGMHLSWIALGSRIPFYETLALISSLFLIGSLPISVGGIGAPQFLAAILYGAFGASPSLAASAQLLLTAVTLVTISFVGLLYLPRIIKEIIKPRIA